MPATAPRLLVYPSERPKIDVIADFGKGSSRSTRGVARVGAVRYDRAFFTLQRQRKSDVDAARIVEVKTHHKTRVQR